MKKLLQLTLIVSALLFTFSCDSGEKNLDPGADMAQTWEVRSIAAYTNEGCSDLDWNYNASAGQLDAALAADCANLETFFSVGSDIGGGAEWTADAFCNSTDELSVSMYLHLTTTDDLAVEAAGNYQKTMYGQQANGLDHTEDYTTYGRYYTYGDRMSTQILAKVGTEDFSDSRVTAADEDPTDNAEWTFESSTSTLKMTYLATLNGNAGPECMVVTFQKSTSYDLRGCTDPIAANYFGGDNNDFGITATKETGNCQYTEDEAAQTCVKIDHQDSNGDDTYDDDEWVTLAGFIDCEGTCQFSGESAWVGDGICDGGIRSDKYNCEAWNWDGWDCACAPECRATYTSDEDDSDPYDGTGDILDGLYGEDELGEGNGWTPASCDDGTSGTQEECEAAGTCDNGAFTTSDTCLTAGGVWTAQVWTAAGSEYITDNCQVDDVLTEDVVEGCNVEACGYDIADIDDISTWDCCSLSCLNSADTATSCDAACDIGACNFYRNLEVDGWCDDGAGMAVEAGCNDCTSETQTACESAGTCDNVAFTTQATCEGAGGTWTAQVWTVYNTQTKCGECGTGWIGNQASAGDVETGVGLCCDQTGADATAGTEDDIDCTTFDAATNVDGLGGNGSCNPECNVGACNFDGGDCD